MLHDDIVYAQRIISHSVYNFGGDSMFHNKSSIYRTTNEKIYNYHEYLINRKRVLSVIGSGDQILNVILEGTLEIDAFDISSFPKYFMYLKMASIKALSREEYIDFIFECSNTDDYYDEIYDRVLACLSGDAKDFWESLFNFFDWFEIYNSTLFSSEPYVTEYAVNQNKYLQSDEAYEELRSKLDSVTINTFDGDIFDLIKGLNRKYDFVYLSNIVYYNDVNKYKKLLGDIHLTDQGLALTYVYSMHSEMKKIFEGDSYSFKKFVNSSAGVVLYHK